MSDDTTEVPEPTLVEIRIIALQTAAMLADEAFHGPKAILADALKYEKYITGEE